MTPTTPPPHGSNGSGNARKKWWSRPITNGRGTIGALIIIGGFVLAAWRFDVEADIRSLADCQSLNDRTRFGLLSRENEVEQRAERVAELEDRVAHPESPSRFPGYADLDESARLFLQGVTTENHAEARTALRIARDEYRAAVDDLELYRDQVPLIDCPSTSDGIDADDFTGR